MKRQEEGEEKASVIPSYLRALEMAYKAHAWIHILFLLSRNGSRRQQLKIISIFQMNQQGRGTYRQEHKPACNTSVGNMDHKS